MIQTDYFYCCTVITILTNDLILLVISNVIAYFEVVYNIAQNELLYSSS